MPAWILSAGGPGGEAGGIHHGVDHERPRHRRKRRVTMSGASTSLRDRTARGLTRDNSCPVPLERETRKSDQELPLGWNGGFCKNADPGALSVGSPERNWGPRRERRLWGEPRSVAVGLVP